MTFYLTNQSIVQASSHLIWYKDLKKSLIVNFSTNNISKQIYEIESWQYQLLDALDGKHSISHLAFSLDIDEAKATNFLQKILDDSIYSLDIVNDDEYKKFMKLLTIAKKLKLKATALNQPPKNLSTYHQESITDAMKQFNEVETTISHTFRERHPALGGLNYGETFLHKILEKHTMPKRILEIGGGVGYFSKSILDYLKSEYPHIYSNVSYTICDLSPELQNSQKKLCKDHLDRMEFVCENILSFSDSKGFDLIISNEVIADLPSSLFCGIDAKHTLEKARKSILKYELDTSNWSNKAYINTGAIEFLENLKNFTSKNAMMVFTEYGSITEEPIAVQLGEHREHSIVFGHLIQVAETLGYQANVLNLVDFLEMDCATEIIQEASIQALNQHLLPYLKEPKLPRLAFTKEKFEQYISQKKGTFRNIRFRRLDGNKVFSPKHFFTLILIKN